MSKATKKEEGLVNDLRNNLKKRYGDRWDKMEKETPETTSKYKMLRFVRGHGKKNAEDAFVLMMEYREKRNVSVVRRRLLDLEKKNGGVMPWPYSMDRFKNLRKLWDGKMPAIRLPDNVNGNPATMTVLSSYKFSDIVRLGLDTMWLDLALHCDVYFDIVTHRLSLKYDRPVSRIDICDLYGLSNTDIGMKAASMIKKMGNSSEHYPEMIGSTLILHMGIIGRAIWVIVCPFLPRTTAAKVRIWGNNFRKDIRDLGFVDRALPPRLDGTCVLYRSCFDSLPYRVFESAGKIWTKSVPLIRAGEKLIWHIENKSSFDVTLRCMFESSMNSTSQHIFPSPVLLLGSLKTSKGSWTHQSATSGMATLCVDNSKSYLLSTNLIVHFYVEDAVPAATSTLVVSSGENKR
jgi:hypothetical protein